MSANWLQENSQRAYPFVRSSPLPNEAIVDAVFCLGADMPLDFNDETAAVVLTSVVKASGIFLLTFKVWASGVQVPGSASMTFSVNPGIKRFGVVRAATASSQGYLTIGTLRALVVGTPNCAVEARTTTLSRPTGGLQLKVYNARKRVSLTSYFAAAWQPGKTPAQNYQAAVAAAPPFIPNQCLDPAVGAISGVCTVRAGFNVVISAVSAENWDASYAVGAGGYQLCGIYYYVLSKVGTNDPKADLDNNGIVDAADVAIAADLQVAPKEITFQTALLTFNGFAPSGGDLVLAPGNNVTIETSPDQNAVSVAVPNPNPPTSCVG
jgi:hypothetical protein